MWSDGQTVFDNTICRFCGSTGRKLQSIQRDEISGNSNEGNAVWQLIKRLVPLKIDPQDRKPQQVCYECISTLEKYDAFISTCLANDINFDNILQSLKSTETDDDPSDLKNIPWPQDGKWKAGTDEADSIFLMNKVNDQSNSQNDDFYIIVELNCKGINIDPVLLKCNENNKTLPPTKENEESSAAAEVKKTDDITTIQTCQTLKSDKEAKPFKCTICNKSLTRKSNLMSHLALHSKERPHKCNECGKNFALFADLTLHKHIHTQSYACNICKKCFVTKSKLERHGKSHTGVKDHACPICKKRFSEKNNMMAHMSVHTGERPFSCPICKKSFRTQSHLTDHGKVHSAESPFKCTICNKSFKWKSNLKDHNKFHSGEKFKCADCMKEFIIRSDYYKHRKECRQVMSHYQETG